MNPEMLALARQAQGQVVQALGYDIVEFRRGRIQDLGLDLDGLATIPAEHPVAPPGWSGPWREVDDITFRSVTVIAYKGKAGPCYDHGQASCCC